MNILPCTINCPCWNSCQDCEENVNRFNEIIEILSDFHYRGFTLPEKLHQAPFTEYEERCPDKSTIIKLKGELLRIAQHYELLWAPKKQSE